MSRHPSLRKRHQIAAVPVRLGEDGMLEVALVTSRTTQRWIVPKGWPMKGRKDHEAAAIEAREEAGLTGRIIPRTIGSYTYWRRTRTDFRLTVVDAYALTVHKQKRRWKEQNQRQVRWADALTAADLVAEPELSTLLVRLPLDEQILEFAAKVSATH